MEEKRERKLHPALQILVVAVIILGCNLVYAFVFSLLIKGKSFNEISSILSATSWCKLIFPAVAAVLCAKVIESRKIGIVKILIIALCATVPLFWIRSVIMAYVGRYGNEAIASFASADVYIFPVITAILIVVFINILSAPKVEAYVYDENMHCGLFKHVILLLFTFGIWWLIWNYRITRYLNCVENEEYRNPATKLLLCMFVPFYSVYWTYKSAQRIDKLAKSVDVVSDLATPCLILEIFVPFIPPILMQDKINKILETSTASV